MKLTEKTMNTVKKESEFAIALLSEGKNAIEIAGSIYCKALPGKESDAGIVMAKRVESVICEYECNVKSALDNSEGWVREQIDKQLEGKETAERCKILFNMLVGVSSLNDVLSGEKTIEDIRNEYAFDINDVSDEYEQSLKEKLIAAVQASAYGRFQLKSLEKALENGNVDVSFEDIIDYGKHEHDVKVIMSMIAYVNAKNGNMDDLPADISIDEIAIAIASTYDVAMTAEQVEEGKITTDMGAKIIKAISTVASFMIAAVLTAATLLIVGCVIDAFLPMLIGIPLIIVAGVAFWILFNDAAHKALDAIVKVGAKVIKGGYAIVKRGVKKLIEFTANHILPKMSDVWKKIKAYFRKLKEDNAEIRQNDEATVKA